MIQLAASTDPGQGRRTISSSRHAVGVCVLLVCSARCKPAAASLYLHRTAWLVRWFLLSLSFVFPGVAANEARGVGQGPSICSLDLSIHARWSGGGGVSWTRGAWVTASWLLV